MRAGSPSHSTPTAKYVDEKRLKDGGHLRVWRGAGNMTKAMQNRLDVTLNQAVGAALTTFRSTGREMNLWLIQHPSMEQAIQKLWDASLL
jgi:hypothetical protein